MKYRGDAHKSGRKRKESEREKKNRHILKLHIQLWIAFTLTIFFFPLHLIFFSTYYRFVIRNSRKMGLLSSKWLLYQLKVSDQHLDSFDKITKPNEIAWIRAEMEHILTLVTVNSVNENAQSICDWNAERIKPKSNAEKLDMYCVRTCDGH